MYQVTITKGANYRYQVEPFTSFEQFNRMVKTLRVIFPVEQGYKFNTSVSFK